MKLILKLPIIGAVCVSLLLGAPGNAQAEPSPAKTAPDAVLVKSLAHYSAELAQEFAHPVGSPSNAGLSGSSRVAESVVGPILESIEAGGDVVVDASVSSAVVGSVTEELGTVTTEVEMITSITLKDDGSGNPTTESWSDIHKIVWDSSRSPMVVVSDSVLPVPDSEETINESATSMGDQQPEEAPIKASESTQPSVKSGGSTVGARPESPSLSSGWPTEARVITHAFSGYALKWTGAPNNGNKPSDFNPKYPH